MVQLNPTRITLKRLPLRILVSSRFETDEVSLNWIIFGRSSKNDIYLRKKIKNVSRKCALDKQIGVSLRQIF